MLMGQYEIDYARRKVEEFRNKSELQEFELKQYLRAQDTLVDRRKCPCCGILSSVEYDNCVKCGKYLGNENIVFDKYPAHSPPTNNSIGVRINNPHHLSFFM